ncbi:hypothetical protein [Streptomyces sp. NPDC050704]|uniref:hypothetical protein n=1 Tax=Streptomyces sp. NPDC050704 TaxID=3157219 RepID=UPI0034231E76
MFAELRRVLTATGTVWLNLGDSYSTTPPGRASDPMRTSTARGRRALGKLRESVQRAGADRTQALPRKNLSGMPWRVDFAPQAGSWILRHALACVDAACPADIHAIHPVLVEAKRPTAGGFR